MAAQTSIVWINGRDVATEFAFAVTGLGGWPGVLGSATRALNLQQMPEADGAILDPRLVTRQPGRATLNGLILGTDVSSARAYVDALKTLVQQGEVAVRTCYATDRYCLAIADGEDGTAFNPSVLDGVVNVALTFAVKDGVAVRTAPDGYALSTARTACPIGTAKSYPVFTIHGGGVGFTNPTITVRDAAGNPVQTMGFTITATASDVLRIDSGRSQVSQISAGTITDGIAAGYWTAGDFPMLRPADGGDLALAAYPTVELSSATGTMQGLVTYERRYA